jgi:hypothetical protein
MYILATAVREFPALDDINTHDAIFKLKHIAVDACRILKAFITYRDEPGGPIVYINALSSSTYLLKSTVYTLQTLVGDACMVSGSRPTRYMQFLTVFRQDLSHIRCMAKHMGGPAPSASFGFLCW